MGRICCDSEGRLNEQSVMLEGGIAVSGGARVRLDLSQVRGHAGFRAFQRTRGYERSIITFHFRHDPWSTQV